MGYEVLGQDAPATAVDTDLYTVPAGGQAVVSSLTVCNRATSAAAFRMAVRPAGAAIADQHYVYYDVEVAGNSTFVFTGGLTLGATDVMTVRKGADAQSLSFNLFGKEIT